MTHCTFQASFSPTGANISKSVPFGGDSLTIESCFCLLRQKNWTNCYQLFNCGIKWLLLLIEPNNLTVKSDDSLHFQMSSLPMETNKVCAIGRRLIWPFSHCSLSVDGKNEKWIVHWTKPLNCEIKWLSGVQDKIWHWLFNCCSISNYIPLFLPPPSSTHSHTEGLSF